MKSIELSGISFGYAKENLFDSFSLTVAGGEFLGVIGPNGSGKSTLLKLVAGLLRPRAGEVLIQGRGLARMSRREVAQIVAVVPQESFFAFDYTVWDVVMMGRNPYLGRMERPGPGDRDRAAKALEFVGVAGLQEKSINDISGGEKQLVVLARALAQEPEILLLDEPTSHLDISHQQSFAGILHRLNRQGTTVMFLSHDLNLAALNCSRILLLHQGRQVACDVPESVVTRELIRKVYGVDPLLSRHPETGRPQVMLPSQR